MLDENVNTTENNTEIPLDQQVANFV